MAVHIQSDSVSKMRAFVLLTFLQWAILIELSTSLSAPCPSGWLSFSGSCYQFNTNVRRNWDDAVTDCANSSSHLVYIDSVEEDRYLVNHLKPLIDASSHNDKRTAVWIGGSDKDHEGFWAWYKSKDPIVEYTNWYPGQPDTGSGHHEEDCICLVGNHGYMWQDRNCVEEMFYVCEKSQDVSHIVG